MASAFSCGGSKSLASHADEIRSFDDVIRQSDVALPDARAAADDADNLRPTLVEPAAVESVEAEARHQADELALEAVCALLEAQINEPGYVPSEDDIGEFLTEVIEDRALDLVGVEEQAQLRFELQQIATEAPSAYEADREAFAALAGEVCGYVDW
jgi:hypothetical protein